MARRFTRKPLSGAEPRDARGKADRDRIEHRATTVRGPARGVVGAGLNSTPRDRTDRHGAA
jgi:hypothetical protein